MNDLDRLLDKLFEDPAFARAYREERITWELQARAVCRYLRGEIERLTHYHIENSTGGDDCIFIDLSEDLPAVEPWQTEDVQPVTEE